MNRRDRRAAAKQGRSTGLAPPEADRTLLAEAARHHEGGRFRQAERLYRQILAADADHADCLHLLGLVLHQTGRSEEALQLLGRAIAANDGDADLHNDIAGVYQALGRFDDAISHCRQALALSPTSVALRLNLARSLHAKGDLTEAVVQYRGALRAAPDSLDCHFNLALALSDQGDSGEAMLHYRQVLALAPDDAEAHTHFGMALAARGHWDRAVDHYRNAIAIAPNSTAALAALGEAIMMKGELTEAITLARRAASLQPDFARAHANLAYFKAQACDWKKLEETSSRVLRLVRQGAAEVPPFIVQMLPAMPADRLLAARHWGESFARGIAPFNHTPRAADRPVRLGYLSHDLRGDVVGRLIPELIEQHDRSRFTVIAYYYGADDGSGVRDRLARAFDKLVDLGALSDSAAAERIRGDDIDILIDLTGYTSENPRPRILAFRPAPIQVNFLGYPGTMGADFIDYIIVDGFLAPAEHQPFYRESLVQLPHCYQPSDTSRPRPATALSRLSCGLPPQGLVFCCFNHSYKLTPAVFDIWMRLLQAVPNSVLWLLASNAAVPDNLRREAAPRGVAPERLVFARHAPVAEYLARLATADLFLDTHPYNAGAVANDALWAGLPVLTCTGDSYVGRMAGSMLHAIGLPELVTSSFVEYEALALELAREPARLAELRGRLAERRARMPLFDMPRYTRDIEAAYTEMWKRCRDGEPPAPIRIRSDRG